VRELARLLFAVCCLAAPAGAAELLSYQGRLLEGGTAVTGKRVVNVFLCDAAAAGNCFGSGEQSVAVSDGLLRATYTVPSGVDLLGGADWHLELRLYPGGTTTLSPRERLSSLPYALVASSAAGLAARAGAPGARVSSSLYIVAGGRLGVGTESPAAALEVVGGIAASGRITGGCENPDDPGDEMVAVGPWCVDKYEASAWSTPTGGTQYGAASDDYPCLDTGQDCAAGAANPIYARSVSGVTPSRSITWFQAAAACANANKELLPNHLWQAAGAGTPDPGTTGTAPNCNISGAAPHTTGAGTNCQSSWGAQDMIGSLWEWTAQWMPAGTNYTNSGADGTQYNNWPAGYGGDGTFNVGGRAYNGSVWADGLPAAVIRGGSWGDGADAGVFAFVASLAPSRSFSSLGFRCGRRR